MKKLITIFLVLISTITFAQGNFTTEWESPAGWSTGTRYTFKLNSNIDIYHLAFYDENDIHNIRLYNGSTHNIDYNWTWSGTSNNFSPSGISSIDYGGSIYSGKFDVSGDGINEITLKSGASSDDVIDPVNGNILYSTTDSYLINQIIDIDGDGFLELILRDFPANSIRIISTPAQTVSIENNTEVVKNYELKQNYPNPFNPSTTIEYTLNRNSDVKIIIYDILGKEVNTLVDQKQVTGTYKLNLNGNDLTSGTYFYSLIVDGTVESKKMILVK